MAEAEAETQRVPASDRRWRAGRQLREFHRPYLHPPSSLSRKEAPNHVSGTPPSAPRSGAAGEAAAIGSATLDLHSLGADLPRRHVCFLASARYECTDRRSGECHMADRVKRGSSRSRTKSPDRLRDLDDLDGCSSDRGSRAVLGAGIADRCSFSENLSELAHRRRESLQSSVGTGEDEQIIAQREPPRRTLAPFLHRNYCLHMTSIFAGFAGAGQAWGDLALLGVGASVDAVREQRVVQAILARTGRDLRSNTTGVSDCAGQWTD